MTSEFSESAGTHRRMAVDHMTLPVGDLDRSLHFYRAALLRGMGWSETVDEGLPTFGPTVTKT